MHTHKKKAEKTRDLDLSRVLEVVKVRAKYHQAECSGSFIYRANREKYPPTKTIQSVATARTVNSQ